MQVRKRILSSIFLTIFFVFVTSCASLKHIEYVPVEKVRTEYVAKVDTTYVLDSIFVSEKVKADTVYLTKEKYKYIYKVKTDTLQVRDTIPVIKEVKVDVPYVPEYYKKVNAIFWTLVAFVLLFLGIKIYKIARGRIG